MKLLLLTAFVVTISYVSAGKTQRLLAAMMAANMNAGMMAGANGGLVNPGILGSGLNIPVVAGGGAGFIGQPQFAQFVPGVPAYALPAPVPNVYPVPAANALPFAGFPQMAQMNPPQQPGMLPFAGFPQMAQMNPPQQPGMGMGGQVMPQQLQPPQPDVLRRFRRQVMKEGNSIKMAEDSQIPAPSEAPAITVCDGHTQYKENQLE